MINNIPVPGLSSFQEFIHNRNKKTLVSPISKETEGFS
jgi:hypothetical protein